MATPSLAVDNAKQTGVDPDHEKEDHGIRQSGCHGKDNVMEGTPMEEKSTKHDKEGLENDLCTALLSKPKSTKKSKRVDKKNVKKTQTSDQVNSKQKSQSQQTDEIAKSMSCLEISDRSKQCHGTGRLGGDATGVDSLEVQIHKLSLEDSQQLLERGPQRNRESHAARQSKPYDRTTTQSPLTCDADEFLKSVLYDENVIGHSDGVSIQSEAAVPCNAPTTSPSPVNLADQWIDSASNSPDTTGWNIPPAITTSGQYQFSGPVQNPAVDTLNCVPFNDGSQQSAQAPAMSHIPPLSQYGAPIMSVIQPGYDVTPTPLNPNMLVPAYPSHTPLTFVSDQPFYLNSAMGVSNNLPNTYDFVGQLYYNPSPTGLSYSTPNLATSTSPGTGCSPHAPGLSTAGYYQSPVSSGIMVYSSVDMPNHVNHTDENDNPKRDPCIPNIVPTTFDDASDADRKPKGRSTTRKKSKTKSVTEKKDKKKKDSQKRPSTSTQSPPVLTAEDVKSSLSNIQTSLAGKGQIDQPVSQDIDDAFQDASEVVTDNLKEDFIAQKLKKGSTQASGSGELDQHGISNLSDYQRSLPNSDVSPQTPNACSEACSFNSPLHPHCDSSLASTQNLTSQSVVPQVPQCNQVQQSISINQQLNQLSQTREIHQDASSGASVHTSVVANLSTHAVSNGEPTQGYQFENPHSAMPYTQTGLVGQCGIPPGQNVPVLQTTPVMHCDEQRTFQPQGQQTAYLQPNHLMTAYEPELTVPQQVTPQPVNPGLVSTTCRTHVQVSVTHPTQGRPNHLQMSPDAKSPQGIALSTLDLGFKMTTPGYSGASPIGKSSTMDIILKRFTPILPKPVCNT